MYSKNSFHGLDVNTNFPSKPKEKEDFVCIKQLDKDWAKSSINKEIQKLMAKCETRERLYLLNETGLVSDDACNHW